MTQHNFFFFKALTVIIRSSLKTKLHVLTFQKKRNIYQVSKIVSFKLIFYQTENPVLLIHKLAKF